MLLFACVTMEIIYVSPTGIAGFLFFVPLSEGFFPLLQQNRHQVTGMRYIDARAL